MKKYLTLANCITSTRLFGAIILIFLEPLSLPFFIVYSISGLSDAIDGFVARKTNGTTEFGSKLDSVSDLSFYFVSFVKVLPFLFEQLPSVIWIFVWPIIGLRILLYILNALIFKQLLSSHNLLNKVTNVMLFFIPFMINTDYLIYYAWMLAGVAIVALIYEFTYSIYYRYKKR